MRKILLFAAALWLPIVNAANAPEIREGLWSVHTQSIDNPGNKKTEGMYSICRSHAYDQHVQSLAKDGAKGCTSNENLQDGKYEAESHCVVGGIAVDSKATTAFQGDTAYHAEVHTTYSPAFGGVSESTMIMDQKYVSSCPAGVQPGDRIGADGRVTHQGRH
jgi:hypothetical protein